MPLVTIVSERMVTKQKLVVETDYLFRVLGVVLGMVSLWKPPYAFSTFKSACFPEKKFHRFKKLVCIKIKNAIVNQSQIPIEISGGV